ncbi:TIGR03756 family integrating conjugative element protein [Klebsiella oxytoca]|nr:TIGR03756 family integrating conjugative element protein [Klebsiella pneumoniae]MBZ7591520.1 TIGR03756 family integrating conjugative element protein [Klebsiella oxytoca]MCB7720253.1 TIGR03756 family integrating conjugative element protein [Klebsiella pneumoniae]MCQ8651438.1 TIGR03756 family integrating conjugative element protein [Klebsiella pneumoniae]HBU9171342.1 TIGR03756 family integrating conjugative element protein [Klebsiella pneumoniae]
MGTATAPAAVAALNTAQIIASAVSQNCISWRVSGICYWLFCTPFGCKVRTSVKVTHFIPQTVVSTYVAPGGNPWQEMAFVSQTAGGLESAVTSGLSGVSAGGANPADMKNPGQRKSAVRFKYADAIGHPATSLIGGSIPGYSCDTAATPLMPYFLSTLDSAAWRTGVPPRAITTKPLRSGSPTAAAKSAGRNFWAALISDEENREKITFIFSRSRKPAADRLPADSPPGRARGR